jgi:YD repeat-containing protein
MMWTRDALGNDLSSSYNEANEVTSGGSSVCDAAGNMLTLKSGDAAKYDAWNRLVEVDHGTTTGTTVVRYKYDGLNRRTEKVFGTADASPHNDYYYNQQWQVLEERDIIYTSYAPALAKIEDYVWSLRGGDSPIICCHDGNANYDLSDVDVDWTHYYTNDAHCNVTSTINADVGTVGVVDQRYKYTPYGEVVLYLSDGIGEVLGPLYGGYFYDAETGLYQRESKRGRS